MGSVRNTARKMKTCAITQATTALQNSAVVTVGGRVTMGTVVITGEK